MAGVFLRRGEDTGTHRTETHVRVEMVVGMMWPQVRDGRSHQNLEDTKEGFFPRGF